MTDQEIEISALRHALKEAHQRQEEDRAEIASLSQQLLQMRQDAQHHVRNVLSVIRSLARRTAEECDVIDEYQVRLDGRLAAFARVQSALIRKPKAAVELGSMILDELMAFGLRPDGQVRLEGAVIHLIPKAAGLMALALHELVADSLRSGALRADHTIAIKWSVERLENESDLCVEWSETDISETHPLRSHSKLSRQILEDAIAYELAGKTLIEIKDDRLLCRFRLPEGCWLP